MQSEDVQPIINHKVEASAETSLAAVEDEISAITKGLAQTSLAKAYELIDNVDDIITVIENLMSQQQQPPSLYFDLEGVNLSRQGSISILQIYVAPQKRTYLVDICKLGSDAFDTIDEHGRTLRFILESPSIAKVFFDVRNDSDALFSHFKISLAGIVDLQVMEYATRAFKKQFVNGLAKCIERDLNLSYTEHTECQRVKEAGLKLFAPERGGSYEVFNKRPLSTEIGLYCVQDVKWLPALYETYQQKLRRSPIMVARVAQATLARVKESQSPSYNGHGKHKALGPW